MLFLPHTSYFSFLVPHFSFLTLTCELCNKFKKLCNLIFEDEAYLCRDVKILSHCKIKKMKIKLLLTLTAAFLFLMPNANFGQAINLGTAADFVLFSTVGAVGNTGTSQLTGNVGSNSGASTGFGNVNGTMHSSDGVTAGCTSDLLLAYDQLNSAISNYSHAPLLGDGTTLFPGVYDIAGNSTLDLDLTLDAQNDPNAVFIFKVQGTLSTNVNSSIKLKNGALACNVFWKIEGLVSMAAGTSMKGTVIANNAAISLNSGASLEGRALAIAGAVNVTRVLAYIPIGCGSPNLTGPSAPSPATTANYALFTAQGTMTNSGISTIKGDVGSNLGLTTGFDALTVKGSIHDVADGSTALCAADLLKVYSSLNLLVPDIELLYPAQLGNNLVLTPHTYVLKGSTVLTDSLYLNAQGNADAVFVIQVRGAFATSTHAKVLLTNGAQAKNVYWKVDGAVSINDYSVICGTIICNNGAVQINTGVTLYGRVLTTNGSFACSAITVHNATDVISGTGSGIVENKNALVIAPNPFKSFATVTLNDASKINNYKLRIFDTMGKEVINTPVTQQSTTLKTSDLHSGIYFYQVIENNKTVQSGKLISQQ